MNHQLSTTNHQPHNLRWAWPVALACFILAASTGSLLRFGMLTGYPAGLQMANIRHAHSHLMYFGWVTPALMALIAARLPEVTGRKRLPGFRWVLVAVFTTALLAYVPFLLYGYRPATFGEMSLPLSTVGAGLNVIAWYAFVILYVLNTRGAHRNHPLRLWDAALGFLVLSSLGAWAIALVSRLELQDPFWAMAATHLFLDLFADGWFLMALLGLVFVAQPAAARRRSAGWGETLLVIGLPLSFLLNLPGSAMPGAVRVLAGIAGVAAAIGIFASLVALLPAIWRRGNRAWLLPLSFLALKAGAMFIIAFPEGARWAGRMALRISYLHWLLLGFVSLGLMAAAADRWGRQVVPARRWFALSVLLLLASLLPLTPLWPSAWRGAWALTAASWATLGPVIVASIMLIGIGTRGLRIRHSAAVPIPDPGSPIPEQ